MEAQPEAKSEVKSEDYRDVAQSMESLSLAISDLDENIKTEVSANYKNFLDHVARIRGLDEVFAAMTEDLQNLLSTVDKLRNEVNCRHARLAEKIRILENLQRTADLIRERLG